MTPLVDRLFAARRSLKDSPHTTAAYRRDLAAVLTRIAAGTDVDEVRVDQLSAPVLRDAFGVFAMRSASSRPRTRRGPSPGAGRHGTNF